MAQIIKFPRNDDFVDVEIAANRLFRNALERKIKDACFAMLEAMLSRGTIKPDKFFMMYQEGDSCSYLNLGYGPNAFSKSVELVLGDGLRDDN
jgi:hypothetical protein